MLGDDIGDGDRFLDHATRGIRGAALLDFDHVDRAQAGAAAGLRGTLAIALGELALGTLLQAANGCDDDAHAPR